MKKVFFTFAAIGSIFASASTLAQSTEVGPYVRGALGASFVDNITINQFYGSVPGGTLNLDTGVRFDVDLGYNFNRYLAAEFEFGWTYNNISSASGMSISGGSFGNFPFLANLVLQLPLANGRLIPYLGGGAGGSIGIIDVDSISANGVIVYGSDSAIAFAYQGFAGLRYAFNEQMSVGVVYKYMGTGNSSYYEGVVFPFSTSGNLGLGTTTTQSIQATFNYRF